jgi:uncharacterized membrane protein
MTGQLLAMGQIMTAKDELEKLDREWMNEKERHGSILHLQLGFAGATVSMLAGILITTFGYWIWDHWEGPEGDAPGYWCIFGGAGLIVVSFVFVFRIARRIRTYQQARCDYEYQRETLLQEIYSTGKDLETPGGGTGR